MQASFKWAAQQPPVTGFPTNFSANLLPPQPLLVLNCFKFVFCPHPLSDSWNSSLKRVTVTLTSQTKKLTRFKWHFLNSKKKKKKNVIPNDMSLTMAPLSTLRNDRKLDSLRVRASWTLLACRHHWLHEGEKGTPSLYKGTEPGLMDRRQGLGILHS